MDNSEWVIDAQVDERDCGGQLYNITYYFDFQQSGNELTIIDGNGNSYVGTISGREITWQGSYADHPGVTTLTLSAEVSDDWLTMEGTSSFVYEGQSPEENCSGSGNFTGVRTVDSDNEPEIPFKFNFADLGEEWPVYMGGKSDDLASAVVVDGENNLIVAGVTGSRTFSWLDGDDLLERDGLLGSQFVLKFDEQGEFLWAKLLSGEGFISGMTVDRQNNILVLGTYTLTKLSPESEVLWTHSLRDWGPQADGRGFTSARVSSGRRVAVNNANQIIIGGTTSSEGLADGGFDPGFNGSKDGFVQVLSPSGDRLWSTYIGGTQEDSVQGIAVHLLTGVIYITGNTKSLNWVSGGMSTDLTQFKDHFGNPPLFISEQTCYVAALSSTGDHLWSTFLGGSLLDEPRVSHSNIWLSDECYAIHLDKSNILTIIGNSASIGEDGAGWMPDQADLFVNPPRLEPTPLDHPDNTFQKDAFAVKMPTDGSRLIWGTYLGGLGSRTIPLSLDSGAKGMYIAGKNWSRPAQQTSDALLGDDNGDGFLLNLRENGGGQPLNRVGGFGNDEVWSVAVDQAGNPIFAGITSSTYWGSWAADIWEQRLNPDPYYQGGSDAFVVRAVPEVETTSWHDGASIIQPAGWQYFDWFKGFKPAEGSDWIFHGRHGWLYVQAENTSRMFFWDGALGRWLFTNANTYPWMYAYGVGWVWFIENGRPGSRYFKLGGTGEVVSENELGLSE